jgi:hypothetical protein
MTTNNIFNLIKKNLLYCIGNGDIDSINGWIKLMSNILLFKHVY